MTAPDATTVRLSTEEIQVITGYTQPRRQLEELWAQGFWRARLNRRHEVILERVHYEAVCAGAVAPGSDQRNTSRPTVQPIG